MNAKGPFSDCKKGRSYGGLFQQHTLVFSFHMRTPFKINLRFNVQRVAGHCATPRMALAFSSYFLSGSIPFNNSRIEEI